MQPSPPIPTNDHEFILWFGVTCVGLFVAGIAWLGRKVYPQWLSQQRQLENYRTESITAVCKEAADHIRSHTAEEVAIFQEITNQLRKLTEAYERTSDVYKKILDKQDSILLGQGLAEEIKELRDKLEKRTENGHRI